MRTDTRAFSDRRLRDAASVEDALLILDEESVDIVLIDGESRGVNSLKGTRAVLESSPQSSVIIMMSASASSLAELEGR